MWEVDWESYFLEYLGKLDLSISFKAFIKRIGSGKYENMKCKIFEISKYLSSFTFEFHEKFSEIFL